MKFKEVKFNELGYRVICVFVDDKWVTEGFIGDVLGRVPHFANHEVASTNDYCNMKVFRLKSETDISYVRWVLGLMEVGTDCSLLEKAFGGDENKDILKEYEISFKKLKSNSTFSIRNQMLLLGNSNFLKDALHKLSEITIDGILLKEYLGKKISAMALGYSLNGVEPLIPEWDTGLIIKRVDNHWGVGKDNPNTNVPNFVYTTEDDNFDTAITWAENYIVTQNN